MIFHELRYLNELTVDPVESDTLEETDKEEREAADAVVDEVQQVYSSLQHRQ